MSRYWYFCATLPGFSFGMAPPMSLSVFLETCSLHLSESDFAEISGELKVLDALELPPRSKSTFFGKYRDWERSFRNELARLRARKLESQEDLYQRPTGVADEAAKSAISCFSIEDPMQAEIGFERERWAAIERLSSLSSFDLDFLMAYGIKLSIAARLAGMETKKGSAGYARYYDDILKRAPRANETELPGVHA